MSFHAKHTDTLNDLIESELGAVDTYHEVVESAVGEPTSARNEFRRLESDHRHSVEALTRHLGLSEMPPVSPGQWRRFIVATQDSFKVLDNAAMMAALKNGETRLATQYERVMADETFDADLKDLVDSTLLPRARAHAQSINRFIAAQSGAEES